MGFTERWPQWVEAAPQGAQDPLGESILDEHHPAVRVFEPRDIRLVVGRNQDPERELICAHARDDGVPIHRRQTGGGAVVLAPGTVVVAVRMPQDVIGTDIYFSRINAHLGRVIRSLTGQTPQCRGHGDLALVHDGTERKILGASLRQARGQVFYLGVFLVADLVPLMERLLQAPSRQPDYRHDRSHGDFCVGLGQFGVTVEDLIAALQVELADGVTEPGSCA